MPRDFERKLKKQAAKHKDWGEQREKKERRINQ